MDDALVLGLDFGGTKLAAGLVRRESGAIVAQASRPTRVEAGAQGSIEDMIALAAEVSRAAGVPVADLAGIGVSFGGPVDAAHGVVLLSHHVAGWEGVPLAALIGDRLGQRVAIENDANAQALAEWRYGAGRGTRCLLSLNVGTGIGGGIVLDGELYRGVHGLAGEIGHTIVDVAGPACTCGKRGCLEAMAAGPAIARRAREVLGRSRDRATVLAGMPSEAITARQVFEAAAEGDPVAQEIVREAIRYLAVGIANAVNVLDPEIVVLGGGVARAGDQLFGPLREAVAAVSAPADPATLRIVPSQLGEGIGIVGGAALVR